MICRGGDPDLWRVRIGLALTAPPVSSTRHAHSSLSPRVPTPPQPDCLGTVQLRHQNHGTPGLGRP